MTGLDRLADIFSWVSVQPQYTGAKTPKYDGWTVTCKRSTGECFYMTARTIEEAAEMMLRCHDSKKVKIKIKR